MSRDLAIRAYSSLEEKASLVVSWISAEAGVRSSNGETECAR